jgi:acetyl-CoA carboxylase biotin carboxyl carrier protein
MDLRKLKTLIDLVADSNITELEVTEGEEKVKIVKGGGTYSQAAPTMMAAAAPQSFAPATSAAAAPVALATETSVPTGKIIKSPMVGTFYAAPAPDKSDFVNVGSSVKSAQTVCIIEAMKLLNEIESGFDGTITEILVQNGTAVEFGQPLFVVA